MASGASDVVAAARVVNTLAEALHGTVLATALTARFCAATPRQSAAPAS